MKAVVKTRQGPGNVEFKDVDVPKIAPDEALIEIKFTGICGTDIHIYHDLAFYTAPVIMGHEYSGVIVEKGDEVTIFEIGDRVTSPATIPCGVCFMCRTNHANRCIGEQKRILGAHRANGTFTKFVAVPSRILHKIPETVSFEEAAVAEPVAVAVHAIYENIGIELGNVVAVQGPGPMGLVCVQVAKAAGAKIIVTGMSTDRERLKLARKLGADHTINIEETDPIEAVKKLTDGLGADIVLEASGASPARRQALEMVRRCGKVGLIGLTGKPTDINLDKIVEGELFVKGAWGTIWTSWRKALILISLGKIQIEPLISAKMPLEKWQEGFRMMEERKASKILLFPS